MLTHHLLERYHHSVLIEGAAIQGAQEVNALELPDGPALPADEPRCPRCCPGRARATAVLRRPSLRACCSTRHRSFPRPARSPDYASNTTARYPVFYLSHGGGDDDAKWSCTSGGMCGYAGLILDNLIAADGRAVVLNTGLPHLDTVSELYVYSSGYTSAQTRATWEQNMSSVFQDAATTNGLLNVPLYMSAGDADIALPNAKPMMDALVAAGIMTFWQQSSGGREWMNWRRYLHQTAQLMFKNSSGCK